MRASLRFTTLFAIILLALSGLAAAQEGDIPPNDVQSDPPSRVARLQFIDGQVSLQPGGVDDWVNASLNFPLTTADRVWTDRDSRAELTMGSAALRMGSESSVTLVNLNDNTAQIELDQGTLELSVRYLNSGDIVEVDTPNFAYTVFKPGEYRFQVQPDQDQSWVTVRRGDGEATGEAGSAVRVFAGQAMVFSQGQSLNHTDLSSSHDDFDQWSEMRERQQAESISARYVAPGTVGYEDLDNNGYWEPSPVYGTVWYPNVAPGWAPYRAGHWAWVEPWGWTWVDDAPWGFAPFHYGRWVFVGNRWAWVPGPVGVRPVYAPALVAWMGGPSFGVSFGIAGGGGVGWVALGWHDPFIPAYYVSPGYARAVNISNSRVVNVTVINNYYSTTNVVVRNTTVTNIQYENARVNGAVVAVPGAAFAAGRPVTKVAVVVPPNAVGRGSFVASASVVPAKEAVLGGHAPVAAPARLVVPRQIVARTPPPPRPVSFEQQRPLLEKSNGVPLSPQVRANLRASAPPPAASQPRPAVIHPSGARPSTPATPAPAAPRRPAVWTNDNIGHTPNQGGQNQGGQNQGGQKQGGQNQGGQNQAGDKDKNLTPGRPASPLPPQAPTRPSNPATPEAREFSRPPAPPARATEPLPPQAPTRPSSPATPQAHEFSRPPAPPARATEPPPPQHKTPPPPPPKEKNEREKDKEKH